MTAVAVWSFAPDADALLDARLERGWEPVPTATRDGDVVLGHAACRATTTRPARAAAVIPPRRGP